MKIAPWNDPTVKWVCENHPTKEQGHKRWIFFECGGAGMPEPTKENIEKGYIVVTGSANGKEIIPPKY